MLVRYPCHMMQEFVARWWDF